MIFNSTLLYALTISSYYDHSPLLMIGPCGKGSKFQMKEFKLSNFLNNALKVNYLLQNISIDSSQFSNFLDTAIEIRSESECTELPTREFFNFQIVLIRCINATNSTFQNANVAYKNGGSINCILSQETDFLVVDRCNFTNCKASTKGGAIYFTCFKNSTIYNAITYCNFVGCRVNRNFPIQNPQLENDELCCGGSVYCDASTVNFRNSVFNSSIIENEGYGGAIYARVNSIDNFTFFTSFNDCAVTNTLISYGGAIYIDLIQKGDYNMSYMTFNNCRAVNGSCVYAQNVSLVTINYTTTTNNGNLLRMGNNDFNFQIGTLILNDNSPLNLISVENDTSYTGSNKVSFILYAPSSFDPQNGLTFFPAITYCFVYIHNAEDFLEIPVVPPYDAREPLEGVVYPERTSLPNPTISVPPPASPIPVPTATIPVPPTNIFTISQPFTNSDVFAAGAGAAAAAGGSGGLSTVAIIFIVIACLIVVIGIIIFVIFYLRSHGRCQCGKGDSLAGMKSSTYF